MADRAVPQGQWFWEREAPFPRLVLDDDTKLAEYRAQHLYIEPATPDDLPVIVDMRQEASDRLKREKGIDQWSKPWPNAEEQARRILASVEAGETWMVRDPVAKTAAATLALDSFAGPSLWTLEEQSDSALYLHRLIVGEAHRGLGSELIRWAGERAVEQGKDKVRIDVWTRNTGLHRYYEAQGFELVRIIESDYPSGALFELRLDGEFRSATESPTPAKDGRANAARIAMQAFPKATGKTLGAAVVKAAPEPADNESTINQSGASQIENGDGTPTERADSVAPESGIEATVRAFPHATSEALTEDTSRSPVAERPSIHNVQEQPIIQPGQER